MQFSIFENDNTLGDARDYDPSGQLLRDMTIRISGTQQSALSPVSAAGIKAVLNGKGWLVEQVSHISDSWFPGVSGFTYRIYAVIGTSFSHSAIQTQIRRDLDGYFNVNGISIESDSYSPQSPVPSSPSTPTPPINSNLPLPPAYDPNNPPAAGSSGVLDNLGLGLGISTPIVLGVGALALILIMRR